ncbi:MAG: YbaB/EbfC family nucleoid-associated protein [Bacteroidetes bacterium]|nr:YbaB/EbfC family nucleoid-associated protein [Bacteroidota bacterium]MCL5026369.1 YbaB/EbfC family nucleoid-associated protein [Chloroflexota bacterium]
MLGNPKMLRQMQERLQKAQEELAQLTVEATVGGGAVTVVMSGDQKMVSIKISPEAVDPNDIEMLEDMIVAGVNEGLAKAQELATKRLSAIAGGLKIPGL